LMTVPTSTTMAGTLTSMLTTIQLHQQQHSTPMTVTAPTPTTTKWRTTTNNGHTANNNNHANYEMTIPKEKAGNCCEWHKHPHKSASDPAPEATTDKNKGGRGEGLPLFSGARWGMGCRPPPISAKFLRWQQEVTKTRTRASNDYDERQQQKGVCVQL
jgi:hypothetical protein